MKSDETEALEIFKKYHGNLPLYLTPCVYEIDMDVDDILRLQELGWTVSDPTYLVGKKMWFKEYKND